MLKRYKFWPNRSLIYINIAIVILGFAVSIWPDTISVKIFIVLVLNSFIFILIDLFMAYIIQAPEVKRSVSKFFSVGVDHEVTLTLKNMSSRDIVVDIYDHYPEQSEINGLPKQLFLAKKEKAKFSYCIKPLLRGEAIFTQVECLIHSPFSFWNIQHKLVLVDEVRVYPNYVPVMQYALLATENHLSMMGILKQRRRGEGSDFHQLREFREGDSMRQIDWKASSRARKMIAREYQDERDQQIIIMMDCGHRMLAKEDDLSHFDHSLNAVLLLSYVSLKQGDSVGVSTFSHENPRWIKPIKGVANLNTLLNGIYDLQPSLSAPDYSTGARDLIKRQRKRALVIVITNLRDDDSADLISATHLLKKYHKVVVASLQEQSLVTCLNKPVINLRDALMVSATHGYQLKRDLLVKQLRNSGIETLDVLPEKLALTLTNTYLKLKSSGGI
ncbi:putative membrane protein [hydrothermal vent metagenome]|uniref:Putative membrane protein n=1 Tax=hydrothermal vent metagenome TaxID=652676 RepID=A0A3B0XGC5_9ZZZZ